MDTLRERGCPHRRRLGEPAAQSGGWLNGRSTGADERIFKLSEHNRQGPCSDDLNIRPELTLPPSTFVRLSGISAVNEWEGGLSSSKVFVMQPYLRRGGELTPTDQVRSGDEDAVFRQARGMAGRIAGAVFYRVETSATGDHWVEVLTTMGDVPEEEAA